MNEESASPSPGEPFDRRPEDADPCALCREVSSELRDIATWLSEGDLTPVQFANTVAELERRKLSRLGFTLQTGISEGPIVHFTLRHSDTGDLCASMDIDPHTGALEIQSACG